MKFRLPQFSVLTILVIFFLMIHTLAGRKNKFKFDIFGFFLANQQSEHTLGHRFCDKEHCVSWLGFNLMLNAGMTEYWKCAKNLE